jgi:hypothetical protein
VSDQKKARCYYIGWDVGAWHCDDNPTSRDAIAILDDQLSLVGEPWRGNISELILKLNTGLKVEGLIEELFRRCLEPIVKGKVKEEEKLQPKRPNESKEKRKERIRKEAEDLILAPHLALIKSACFILAIDTPLGWPRHFLKLLSLWSADHSNENSRKCELNLELPSIDLAHNAIDNPLLYRKTESSFGQCLSAVQGMIGSQSTKAIYLLSALGLSRKSTGVWTTSAPDITCIETYPAPCMRSLSFTENLRDLGISFIPTREDEVDAIVCAYLAATFYRDKEGSYLSLPATQNDPEGWVFAPRDSLHFSFGVSYKNLVGASSRIKRTRSIEETIQDTQLGIVMIAFFKLNLEEDFYHNSDRSDVQMIARWLRKLNEKHPQVIQGLIPTQVESIFSDLFVKKKQRQEESEKQLSNNVSMPSQDQFSKFIKFIHRIASS